jgi:4-amino-4-deoxy-L-arabinose transferase-like glycosyltransferase
MDHAPSASRASTPLASSLSASSSASSPSAGTSAKPSLFDRFTEWQMIIGVLLFGLLLYLPFAGSYGLFDPWETHYGEVAREMTVRRDFVSLYWAGSPIDSENFWSKPVLTFWLMSLAFLISGIGGRNAPSGEMAITNAPEWALRTPFLLMALLALVGVYLVASRFVSRRAGVLATIVLATCPLFGLVARQAMTDMPFVGPMTLALALGTLALFDEDDRDLPRRRWRWLSWPHHHLFYLTIGLFVLVALPQLVINSATVEWAPKFLRRKQMNVPGIVLMLPYFAGFFAFIYWSARTQKKAPFYLYLAGILCALAVLAKGLAGLGLPVIVFLAYLLFTWNWSRLARNQLGYGVLIAFLACAVVAIPWHHAMLARHGLPFWDELYGDNHWRRLVMGRHGDRGTFEYFLRELGYAALPWIALAPGALTLLVSRLRAKTPPVTIEGPRTTKDRQREIYWLGAIWFVSAYAVVSLSMTKFHHYILPSLPGLALVVGCFLDDLLRPGRSRVGGAIAIVGLPVLALVTHDLTSSKQSAQLFIWLFSYDYVNTPQGRPWPPDLDIRKGLLVFAGLFAVGTLGLALARERWRAGATAFLALTSIAFSYFLLDGFLPRAAAHWSQKPLIAKYYRTRKSPEERLIAWQMYWRGETFYTANEIFSGSYDQRTVFLGDRNQENLKDYLGRNRGKRVFFIVEKARWTTLSSLIPSDARPSLQILDQENNKFYLASAQL